MHLNKKHTKFAISGIDTTQLIAKLFTTKSYYKVSHSPPQRKTSFLKEHHKAGKLLVNSVTNSTTAIHTAV